MHRIELDHVLRAASRIVGEPDVVIIGSQSILGSYSEVDLPPAAHASIEVDVAFFDDTDNQKSDLVDAMLGEDSHFHATFGYYAQGVEIATATLPAGWRDRVVVYTSPATEGAQAHCLEPHDLVVSKLVASREKDREFATALLDGGVISPATLLARAATLDVPVKRAAVTRWIESWVERRRGRA